MGKNKATLRGGKIGLAGADCIDKGVAGEKWTEWRQRTESSRKYQAQETAFGFISQWEPVSDSADSGMIKAEYWEKLLN